jgi:Srg family chemoreceptor.
MKKKVIGLMTIMMMLIPEMVLARKVTYVACGNSHGIPEPVPQMTSIAYTLLIVGTPLVLIAFSVITLVKAMTAGSSDDIMKAKAKLVKKFLAAGLVFVVAAITQFVVAKAADLEEEASIMNCINCFLYNSACMPSDSGNDVRLPDGSSSTLGRESAPNSGQSLNSPNSTSGPITNKKERYDFIFGTGNNSYGNHKSASSCPTHAANITNLAIPVWKVDASGNWYSSTAYIEVNTKLVSEIKAIFDEIYELTKNSTDASKKTPIKAIGGYRCPETFINHPSGTAIDINPDENYYIKGSITVGNFWKPGIDIYSMPADGIIVQTFKKYGWDWGGEWNSLKDYMHFSYLGG